MISDVINNLLALSGGVLFINALLAATLWFSRSGQLHRTLFFVWTAMLLSFGLQGIFSQGSFLAITIAFSSTFLVNLALAFLCAQLGDFLIPWGAYTICIVVGLGLSIVANQITERFLWISLPVSLAVPVPLLHALLLTFRNRVKLTAAGFDFIASCVLFTIHNLDFAFLRDKPGLQVAGFTFALLIVFALSITAPAVALQSLSRHASPLIRNLNPHPPAANAHPNISSEHSQVVTELSRARITCALVAVLILVGAVLDWTAHPDLKMHLLKVRGASSIIALELWALTYLKPLRTWSKALFYAPLVLCAVTVQTMIERTGGYRSPYYGGLCLCMIGVVLAVPKGRWEPILACAAILSMWTVRALMTKGPLDHQVFINNFFFLFGTGAIASAISMSRVGQSTALLVSSPIVPAEDQKGGLEQVLSGIDKLQQWRA